MKFKIDGYEYEDYHLSNEQILSLLKGSLLTDEERAFLMKKVLDRFEQECCARIGEGRDELFARNFSDYVNRWPHDKKKAAKAMARDHRTLQEGMFIVCLEYMKLLAEAFKNGIYDPRNEWAAKCSNKAIQALTEAKLVIW